MPVRVNDIARPISNLVFAAVSIKLRGPYSRLTTHDSLMGDTTATRRPPTWPRNGRLGSASGSDSPRVEAFEDFGVRVIVEVIRTGWNEGETGIGGVEELR